MPSSAESICNTAGAPPKTLKFWNRRIHIWIGLFTLLFVWLFAWTGLLLNHQWKFAEFWDSRRQSTIEHDITVPPGNDLAQARDILRQIGITGEIDWTTTRENGRFDFRVSRPGQIVEIKTDLSRNHVSVHRIDLNAWGVMRIMHTFTGVRMDDSRNTRDWYVTMLWAFSMDAVAICLIVLAISGALLWWERVPSRLTGAMALASGVFCCGLFWFGLRWIY